MILEGKLQNKFPVYQNKITIKNNGGFKNAVVN